MFTKAEMRRVMRQADDRKDNELVIDENGRIQLLSGEAIKNELLYPVRNSHWNAHNKYCGKYSKLETLNEDYCHALAGWLEYLTKGHHCYLSNIESPAVHSVKKIRRHIKKRTCAPKRFAGKSCRRNPVKAGTPS